MVNKIISKIVSISFLKVLAVLGGIIWLFIQYQTFRVDVLSLKIAAQDLQIKKVGLLLQADCFKDEARTKECEKLFKEFGITLPVKK